jgi:hypothetical protein
VISARTAISGEVVDASLMLPVSGALVRIYPAGSDTASTTSPGIFTSEVMAASFL